MKRFVFPFLIGLAAVVSVIAAELLVVAWLQMAPFDVTGNIYLYGAFPVHLLVTGFSFLVLHKIFRHQPALYPLLYSLLSISFYVFMLAQLNNPVGDQIRYALSVALACAVCFALWRSRLKST